MIPNTGGVEGTLASSNTSNLATIVPVIFLATVEFEVFTTDKYQAPPDSASCGYCKLLFWE